MNLRIGYLSTFYHTSVLMIARGTLSGDTGLEGKWRLFGTGPAIVEAFQKRELDLAYIGLPPAIIGIANGVPIKCIAGGHMEGTVISGKAHCKGFPEIGALEEILKQFMGLTIGVPGKGSIHDVILNDVLRRYNLTKDIEVMNFQWADQVLEAMHRGDVSAAVGTPALAAAVKRFADGKILYPPFKLWPNNPSYGILAEQTFLERAWALAERFLALHEDTTFFLRNHAAEASGIIADYVGVVDKELVLDAISISPRYCASVTDEYIASTMQFVKVLKGLGYINREIPSGEIFDTSLIKKIHPEKDHY
ncbi:MAG: sulfonate ABC transporter substrate-binding protein [Nitrospira bacterium SG8_35_4]|nr:MAG: sulfonate ABC transporter substrate-binding protein [Nitrospira bacterium SG8_35_4]